MRFSLFHLLLLFLAYVLSIMLAAFLLLLITGGRGGHPRWQFEVGGPRQILLTLRSCDSDPRGEPFTAELLNRWMEGKLTQHEILKSGLSRHHPDPDVWGRPYHVVRNLTLDDGTRVELGVYSLGEDGVSRSNGNDPDDINTWSESWRDYYLARTKTDKRSGLAVGGLVLLPFVYLMFFLLPMKLAARRRRTRSLCGPTQ